MKTKYQNWENIVPIFRISWKKNLKISTIFEKIWTFCFKISLIVQKFKKCLIVSNTIWKGYKILTFFLKWYWQQNIWICTHFLNRRISKRLKILKIVLFKIFSVWENKSFDTRIWEQNHNIFIIIPKHDFFYK